MANKKYTYAYIGGALALFGIATLLIIRNKNKKAIKKINDILDVNVKDPNQSGSQVIITKSEYDSLPNGQYPIKFGEKNKRVYEIQKLLNRNYGTTIDVDGKYGDSTFRALCDKVWSSWYQVGECYEIGSSITSANVVRRYIRETDYETIKNHKN